MLAPPGDGVVVGDAALLDMAENRNQLLVGPQGPVRIGLLGRQAPEPPVPARHKLLFQITVGLFQTTRASPPQRFHQPVLQRPKTPFHPSLGLRRVRRDPSDAQLLKRPCDLRRLRFLLQMLVVMQRPVQLKQARFIGVHRHRTPVLFQVPPQQPHVLRRRIRQRKLRRQLARGVIDHRDQIQLLPATPFQPIMLGGVPLHQLPAVFAPRPPHMHLL